MEHLKEFAAPRVSYETFDFTWVFEYRRVNKAGAPVGKGYWKEWSAYPANSREIKNPGKSRRVQMFVGELLEDFRQREMDIEYRVVLQRTVERSENVAATPPIISRHHHAV